MQCRHCANPLNILFVDLESSPLSNAYLTQQTLNAPEKWFPLKVWVCACCWLAQTNDFSGREEIFSAEYAYFSSYSTSWLSHCQNYSEQMIQRFNLGAKSLVGEIACNDGYMLQFFKEKNIPCFGVEPTQNTANVAMQKNIKVFVNFFGIEYAKYLFNNHYSADLLIANNVLAHVPDINDFVTGFSILLKKDGVATFEFPHLYQLIKQYQFDTIYHEHFSYLSLTAVKYIFEKNGLEIFDVEQIATHGGSLRVFAQRLDANGHPVSNNVNDLLTFESKAGVSKATFYTSFHEKIAVIKQQFLNFLLNAKSKDEKVVAYGAAAKGNTLLNFSGIRSDLISYVVDRNPNKQNKFLPGSRIPIMNEYQLKQDKPRWIIILPWNLKDEIATQLDYARAWGAKFVIAIPELTIF